ncbi:MAG: hypothetical protein ACYDCK_09390 [Thermoplasmatota archaeon]
MKANRASRDTDRSDAGGAEVIGAIILFGIFVATLAILNLTAVPQGGKNAEQTHQADVLDRLNGLQASAEGIALPATVGASVSQSVKLAPSQEAGHDFMSFFLATPGTAAGELSFVANSGGVSLSHTSGGATVYDIGSATAFLPLGRVFFDPHSLFAAPATDTLTDGAVITSQGGAETIRFAPPVTVKIANGGTNVTVLTRVLNGTSVDIGGTTAVRVSLAAESVALNAPASNNADTTTFKIETANPTAWSSYLTATSSAAGLASGTQFTVTSGPATDGSGLTVVTWSVNGLGGSNDIRLTSGLAIFRVGLS